MDDELLDAMTRLLQSHEVDASFARQLGRLEAALIHVQSEKLSMELRTICYWESVEYLKKLRAKPCTDETTVDKINSEGTPDEYTA